MSIIIKHNGKSLQQIAEDIQKAIGKLPVQIGNEAVNFVKENFEKEGFQLASGVERWKQRKHLESRKLLMQRGNLKRSISKQVVGNRIKIYADKNTAPYAAIHNNGGTVDITVTPKLKRWAWAMYKKTGEQRFKNMALTKKTSFSANVPQRKFIGQSNLLDKRVIQLITNKLNKAVNS